MKWICGTVLALALLMDSLRIVSFDIGKKNLAYYVEDCSFDDLKNIKSDYDKLPTKSKKRKMKEEHSEELREIVDRICLSGKRVITCVHDVREDTTSDKFDVPTRRNIIKLLDSLIDIFSSAHLVLIEQQFFSTWSAKGKQKGSEANVDAIKIAELVFSWFLITFPFKEVRYISSVNKTLVLGAPYGLDKVQRKEWSIMKTRQVYYSRKDEGMMEIFKLKDASFRKRLNDPEKQSALVEKHITTNNQRDIDLLSKSIVEKKQKLCDISDAFTQTQAAKFMIFMNGKNLD